MKIRQAKKLMKKYGSYPWTRYALPRNIKIGSMIKAERVCWRVFLDNNPRYQQLKK